MTTLREAVDQLRKQLVKEHAAQAPHNAYAHAMIVCADRLEALLAESRESDGPLEVALATAQGRIEELNTLLDCLQQCDDPPFEVARASDDVLPYVGWDEEDYEIAQFVRRSSASLIVAARRIRLLRKQDSDDRERAWRRDT